MMRVSRAVLMAMCLLPVAAVAQPTTDPAPVDPGAEQLKTLAKAARAARRDPAVQTAYGRALLQAGDPKRAERVLERAARLQKDSPEALYELARIRFADEGYRRSRAACAELERMHPEHVLGSVCWARAFLVWRRGSRADERLQEAMLRDPEHPEVLLATADVRRVEGKRDEARAAYGQYLNAHPGSVQALIGLGKLELSSGDKPAALEQFRRAVAAAPYSVEALYLLGVTAAGPEAVDALQRLLAARPDYPEGRVALGRALLGVGEAQPAVEIFEQALKRNRRDARAHIGLGLARLGAGQLQAAEDNLKEGLSLRPDFAEANLALADIYERTERFEEAFEQYRTAAGKRPTDAEPLVDAGRLAVSLARGVLASAFLHKALERAPQHAAAHALLGDVLLRRGDHAEAKSHYEQALSGKGELDRAAVTQKLAKLK